MRKKLGAKAPKNDEAGQMDKNVWRLLEIDVNSYAEATMSLFPAIARACAEGAVPETLAMYTHRKPSIVMGRQNDPEVDLN